MEKQTATEAQSPAGMIQQIRARIITVACLGVGLAVIAIVGGWALTGTLTDWETVVGGVFILGILTGLVALARKGRPGLAAGLLAGMLFLLVSADVTYYGLGSPSAMAFLLPVLLVALVFGLVPGLSAAALAAVVVFGVAWASLNGMIIVETLVDESHLSYNAPVISVILLFCAGLAGTAVEAYRQRR